MIPRLKTFRLCFAYSFHAPVELISSAPGSCKLVLGTLTHDLRKWVVVTYVSANNFFECITGILMILTIACSGSSFVLMFGSLEQVLVAWPFSLQQRHFTFFWKSISNSISTRSSSSFLSSCLKIRHPTACYLVYPQHHQTSPLHSPWCERQLHLKLCFSSYSLPHCEQTLMP